MRWCCGMFLVAVLGVAASGAADVAVVADAQAWWKAATLYQIYPRSFKDTDGNGVGDLKGITQMAGYIKDLGVDAVWLSPMYTSPMADFGYDISNFTDVDPIFGTMQDFDDLVAKFKELDIKVLLDFVPNHSSDEHPWFKKSVLNDSDYADFFVWQDPKYKDGVRLPPNNWISVFSGSAWEWNDNRKQYYLHQFATKQPDLNYRNPAVVGNMTAVINFWLDKGVDGFRMDAVQHMYEAKNFSDEPKVPGTPGDTWTTLQHIYTLNQPETRTTLLDWADVVYNRVQQDGRPRIIILEVYDKTPVAVSYYGKGNESLEFPFNFNLLSNGNQSARAPLLKFLIDDWISQVPTGGQLNWAVGNHDNPRVADRYGPELVDAINLLTGVLPGIKVTYQGEEIGMRDTFIRWDQTVDPSGRNLGPDHYLEGTRDPQRTPMQWDDTVSSGFSSAQKTWLPVNPNYWWLNVDAQRNSGSSHLNVFKTLMKARKDPVLQYGAVNVTVPDNDTLVVVRSYEGAYFALLINIGSESRTYTSQNLFANYSLDVSMYVVVSSTNSGYQSGVFQEKGSLNLTLRPKAAVLLTTKTWAPSPTGSPPAPTISPNSSSTPQPSGAPRLLAVSPILVWTLLLLTKWP